MATQTTYKYGDTIKDSTGKTVGTAVYDPNTGKPLAGAQTYNPNTGSSITSELLKQSPSLTLPNPTTPSYGGVQGAVESLVNQTKSADQIARDEAKANADNTLKQLIQETINQGSISTSVDRSAQDAAKQKSDLYTSQLEQEQLANRRATEAIINNPGIATAAQRQAEIADITRKSLSKQADIAILQTAANRDYETASAIADRQVQLKLEQSNAKLNALKFFYEQNRSDFTTADNRLYEQKIKEEERAYNKQEEFEKTLADIKINVAQSDAPNKLELLGKLSNAKTMDEALKIAGQYSGDYLKVQLLKEQIKTEKAQQSNYYTNIAKTKSETGQNIGKLTDAQVQNAGYADRIQSANNILESNADTLKNMNYAQFKLVESKSSLANTLLTPAQQEVAQAMRNFITAKLRKESGAAISPAEFEDARLTYFPIYGDSDEVLKNKKDLRDSVLNNLALGSGGAFTISQQQTNKFNEALGKSDQIIPGTSIISDISSNGSINFNIPTK